MNHRIIAVTAFVLAIGPALAVAQQQPPSMPGASPSGPPATSQQPAPPAQQGAQMPGQTSNIDPALLEMKADEIAGRDLMNTEGKAIGKVDSIARNTQDNQLYAVISVGGFLGIGASKVAMPLEQLRFENDRLTTTMVSSSRDLRTQGMPYDDQRFAEVESDVRLAEAMPSGGAPTTAQVPPTMGQQPGGTDTASISFEVLDTNRDGFISLEEARGNQMLVGQWRSFDTNRDGRLDRSEFAAFEGMESGETMRPEMRQREQYRGAEPPPQQQNMPPPAQPAPQGRTPQ